jgi:L-lactate dehydrogenase complex protein LldG
MNAREAILGRLRATPMPAAPALPDVAGWYAAHRRDEDLPQRCARLRAALESVHAEVHEAGASDWAELLLRIARAKGLRTLLVGNGTVHGALLERVAATSAGAPTFVRYDRAIEHWRDELFDTVDASVTLARSAIAETGSLVLWPTPAEPRLMSLVPPLHFVLLDMATIHADFDAAMRAEGWSGGMPTNALLISGPSKTADIQQTLAYGAHGPKELVVLLRHAPTEGAAA